MVCGRGPSLGKKVKQNLRSFDDNVLQKVRPYAQEALTVVGGAVGGPVGASIGSTLGGMIEGQDFEDALKGGAISGLTAGLVPGAPGSAAAGGGSATFSSLGQSFTQGLSNIGQSITGFLQNPVQTIKSAIPSFSDLSDMAVEKMQAELQRLPENAAKSALEMLQGADPQQVNQMVSQGGSVMDIIGSIGQGVIANNASKDIIDLNREQFNKAMQFQTESRDIGIQRSQPFAETGAAILPDLSAQAAQPAPTLGDVGTTLEEVNPLVSFLRDEGFRDIEERAAARGRLGAGGTLRDLARFNTQLSSTIVPQLQQQKFNQMVQRGQFGQQGQQQRFGQLFDVARLGANAVSGQNTLGSSAASNLSNLAQNFATSQADALANRANVLTGTVQDLLVR